MSTLIKAEGVNLAFGGLEVLKDVSIDVPEEGITAIIGPNGAGKTALLNCISGIYKPQSGTILFQGGALQGQHPEKIARMGIGRSFQNLELFAHLTVTENLLVARDRHFRGGSLRSMIFWGAGCEQEIRQRDEVEKVIDFFELWHARNVKAEDLPYGQQKIVGVARAMATSPTLLLLDEPGSGLTRDEKEDLARFLLRLRYDWGVCILWVEHDLQMVLDLASRMHVLHLGECIASGSPDEIRNQPEVVKAYVGSAGEQ
jgi:branched-chain amino acid transport system ATP-binding protein